MAAIAVYAYDEDGVTDLKEAHIMWNSANTGISGFKYLLANPVTGNEEATLRVRAPGYRNFNQTWVNGISGFKEINVTMVKNPP